ncbi:hypothetical protein ALC62_00159 [Cyphomyrmex costatus]|nr:hypothetical protein ALC62_00159 [Cyphomyrmex costatus]
MGKNYAGIELFSMIMNMKPFSKTSFHKYLDTINNSVNKKLDEILETARSKVKKKYFVENIESQEMTNITVSYDGSWLTRGHTSLLGVGCVIDVLTGYVIDFEIMTKYCHECVMAKFELGEESAEFFMWMESHQSSCQINHTGSSGAMEMTAAVDIWRRSEKFGFRYSTMLSDGDSKTLSHLNEMEVYGKDFIIQKEECINHVKKRQLGTALRDIVKLWRNRGVTLGGRMYGALKGTTIDKLCKYYQAAIYRNKNDVTAMKNEIMAIIYHGVSTDENPQHQFCPAGENSWCFYQTAKARGVRTGLHIKNIGTPINKLVFDKILPVFVRLSDESLLSRCTQGRTQNANECLHSLIWNKCPKEIFVSKKRLQIAVAEAISQYNDGFRKSTFAFLESLNFSLGTVGDKIAHRRDQKRAKQGKDRNNKMYQKVRKAKNIMRKRIDKALEDSEGVTYKAGAF